MAEFSVEYINPFLMAATSVIKDICQVDMKIGRPYVKTTEFASDSVIIMIGVTGEVRGQVLMSFPEAHALHVASKMMMGMPVTALDDMSASAINELGNMMEKPVYIVELEDGESSLEETFAGYEAGMKLVRSLSSQIDKVEKQIQILSEGEDNE